MILWFIIFQSTCTRANPIRVRHPRQLLGLRVLCGRKRNPTDWWLSAHQATACGNAAPSPHCMRAVIYKSALVHDRHRFDKNRFQTAQHIRGCVVNKQKLSRQFPVSLSSGGMCALTACARTHSIGIKNTIDDISAPPPQSTNRKRTTLVSKYSNKPAIDRPGQQLQHPQRCSARRHPPPTPCPRGSPATHVLQQ